MCFVCLIYSKQSSNYLLCNCFLDTHPTPGGRLLLVFGQISTTTWLFCTSHISYCIHIYTGYKFNLYFLQFGLFELMLLIKMINQVTSMKNS